VKVFIRKPYRDAFVFSLPELTALHIRASTSKRTDKPKKWKIIPPVIAINKQLKATPHMARDPIFDHRRVTRYAGAESNPTHSRETMAKLL
jgi:hypothetical protein